MAVLRGIRHVSIQLYSLVSRRHGQYCLLFWLWGSASRAFGRIIAQGDQPVGRGICHAAQLQWTVSLVDTPLEHTMIMPDRQQRQHPWRQEPMHRQMWSHNAV